MTPLPLHLLQALHHRMHPTEPHARAVAVTGALPGVELYAIEQNFWQYITYTALLWQRAAELWVLLPRPMETTPGARTELSSIEACAWRENDPDYVEALRAELGALGAATAPSGRLERARLEAALHGTLTECLADEAPHRHADALALVELLLTYRGSGSRDVHPARVVPEPRTAVAGGWQVSGTSFKHEPIDGYAGGFRDVTARLTLAVDGRDWNLRRQVIGEVVRPGLAMT